MLVPGILGFPSILLLFMLIFGSVVRQKWRNAVARKEEVTRLLVMASEEAAMAEIEATVGYSPMPIAKRYQCAVCFSPTTTRCSRCKAVKYCSGKCQISHWRQGHRDECRPQFITMQSYDGSVFSGEAQKQFDVHGNGFGTEGNSSLPFEDPLVMVDDDKLRLHTDTKHIHFGYPSSSTSSFSAFTPSIARSDASFDVSLSEDVGSATPDRLEGPSFYGGSPEMLGSNASLSDSKQTTLRCTESIDLDSSVKIISRSSKLNKIKSSYGDKVAHSRSQLSKSKRVLSEDEQNLVNNNPIDGAASSEQLVVDAFRLRSSPFPNCPRSHSVANHISSDSQLCNSKEVRSMPIRTSGENSYPTTGGHANPSFKSAKVEMLNELPAKVCGASSLPQNARSGLKTSVHKVVQQFKASKKSKPELSVLESEIAEKYNFKTFFPYELFVKLYSCKQMELYPFGLVNCGNSCYANAVLQCLAFTRPLTSYLLRGIHSKACQKEDWCFICEFECLILKGREGNSPLHPIGILSQIQRIGSHLGHGKEEDAHEFLRYAVDTMQSASLKEGQRVGSFAEETTLVGLTFGGYLRSKIKCMKCLGKFEQCERMMDLTVEIDGDIRTLEEALAQFTASEILDGKNKYQCKRCKSYQKAQKKLTVLEAPNVLTIVLKRFQPGNLGKLNKQVQFPEVLNIASFMSTETSDKSPLYSLYAVIVHLDFENAAYSGHYVCYVKNLQGDWFKIDDSTVTPVESERVLSEGAYILLYARQSPRPPALLRNSMTSHEGKHRRRNLEAVPSSVTKSKTKSNSLKPSTDPSQQKVGKPPYQRTLNGPASNQVLLDPEDWRLQHSMQRFRVPDSSSSESSSLFSCSDVGSCSTESTKDSDFSDYIFGEVGASWYNNPYGHSSDTDPSSPLLLFSRPNLADSSFPQNHECQNFDSDTATDASGNWRWLPPQGQSSSRVGEENSSILYRKLTKKNGISSNSRSSNSSNREIDIQQSSCWTDPFDTRSGVPFRKSTSREKSAQTFY